MPYIEMPSDLADALADMLGLYDESRSLWVADMAERIRKSVANEEAHISSLTDGLEGG